MARKKYAKLESNPYWATATGSRSYSYKNIKLTPEQRCYANYRRRSYNITNKLKTEKSLLEKNIDYNGNILSAANRAKKERYVAALTAERTRLNKAKAHLVPQIVRHEALFVNEVKKGYEPSYKFDYIMFDKAMKDYVNFYTKAKNKY